MTDKIEEIMDQYGLQLKSSYRGRGATICQTQIGMVKVEPHLSSKRKLYKEYALKDALIKEGYQNVDQYLKNTEGTLITYDRYYTPLVVKHFFKGSECDLLKESDVIAGAKNLANLHLRMKEIPYDSIVNASVPDEGMEEQRISDHYEICCKIGHGFYKHNKEMARVYRYILGVKKKKEFELSYLQLFEQFYKQGEKTLSLYQALGGDEKRVDKVGICHGAYHQHNIYMLENDIATLGFNQFHIDDQLSDLYLFSRKALEKNHYAFSLGEKILKAYDEMIPLCKDDYGRLYCMFLYPEKFWKLSNQYMNRKKTWIPPKSLEKINSICRQEEEKNGFLLAYASKYGIHF